MVLFVTCEYSHWTHCHPYLTVLYPRYSDHRFNLLFRAVDSIGGDGCLEEEELVNFMFPDTAAAEDQPTDVEASSTQGHGHSHGHGHGHTAAPHVHTNSDLSSATQFGTVNPLL